MKGIPHNPKKNKKTGIVILLPDEPDDIEFRPTYFAYFINLNKYITNHNKYIKVINIYTSHNMTNF